MINFDGKSDFVNLRSVDTSQQSVCYWSRVLSASEVEQVYSHGGDCTKAKIPCDTHRQK